MKKISDWTLLRKILEGASFAVLAGMFLGLLILWGRITNQIPGHYNGAGVLMTGFMISSIGFALRQRRK